MIRLRAAVFPILLAQLLCIQSGALMAEQQAAPPDPRKEAISADFPYESKFVEVNGSRMHYVEEGEGDPILFVHGNPTSSYLWRNVIPHVAPEGRAIALDLIGFGRSDKPDIGYTFQEHYQYIAGFIRELKLKNLTLVVHDWGSLLGLAYAERHTDNVRGVAFMEAIIPPVFPLKNYAAMGPENGPLFKTYRETEEGRKMIIDDNYFVEVMIPRALTRTLSEREMNAYRAPFLDPASRFPIYIWPKELPIEGTPARNVEVVERVGEWLRKSATPKLLLHVRPGGVIPVVNVPWMEENFPNLETVFVGYGRHYIQEDNPEAIGRNIASWYRRQFKNKVGKENDEK